MRNLLIAFILFPGLLIAQYTDVELYLHNGSASILPSYSFSYLSISKTDSFHTENAIIRVSELDSLRIKLHNRTDSNYSFAISYLSGIQIDANDSATFIIGFSQKEICQLYIENDFPNYKNVGAVCMIVADQSIQKSFYWHIQEHQGDFNDSILNGYTVNWQDYEPNVFTINGKVKPEINEDTLARVSGLVGDTILIYVANSGQSMHSMHFHGYHAEVIYSNKNAHHIGRSKDTFPLLSMENIILRLVPHQPGEYPVHDHNLVAVSGNGIYPNGIFLTLLIQ